ncbi:Mitochondrial carrier protein [Rutstroemia sp. NJR-2017a BVV2]|nr:Mitochondrial carrier protein [Rutstroemia sp. NJR-2017a BVV2]
MEHPQNKMDKGPIYFFMEENPNNWFLSQWYPIEFTDETGQKYTSSEHQVPRPVPPHLFLSLTTPPRYMMHHKALFFNDRSTASLILQTSSPQEIQALGRSVKNFNSEEWAKVRYEVVVKGNVAKFSRGGTEIRECLERTGERELVEASPTDRVWGVGFGVEECERMEREGSVRREGWGENLCGRAIMEARGRVREMEGRRRGK